MGIIFVFVKILDLWILYDKVSGSHKWHATSDQFSFNYNDKVLSVEYTETDLVCFKKRDSLTIFETSGIYYPVDEIWMGTKGKSIWKDKGQRGICKLQKIQC